MTLVFFVFRVEIYRENYCVRVAHDLQQFVEASLGTVPENFGHCIIYPVGHHDYGASSQRICRGVEDRQNVTQRIPELCAALWLLNIVNGFFESLTILR